jgi:hypothetical protein
MNHVSAPTRRQWLWTTLATSGLIALTGCAAPVQAHAQLAALELVDRDSGQVAPVYHQDGRAFAPGRPGARYALRLRNLSGARVLVVLSVDGVNVISGETADWRQVGYVLDPGRSYDITGWRKSDTQVAAFEFAPIERSYAAQTGRPGNVGVIGMAVFRQRVSPPPPPPSYSPPVSAAPERRSAESLGATAAAPAAPAQLAGRAEADSRGNSGAMRDEVAKSRLGTGHGQREWSVTRNTSFERARSSPDQVTQLEYDSLERLVAAGIIPGYPAPPAAPRPFPSNTAGYVPDPPRR